MYLFIYAQKWALKNIILRISLTLSTTKNGDLSEMRQKAAAHRLHDKRSISQDLVKTKGALEIEQSTWTENREKEGAGNKELKTVDASDNAAVYEKNRHAI